MEVGDQYGPWNSRMTYNLWKLEVNCRYSFTTMQNSIKLFLSSLYLGIKKREREKKKYLVMHMDAHLCISVSYR